MNDRLTAYRTVSAAPTGQNRLWPLYGAGMENLGRDGAPVTAPLPPIGPDELLVRHDACGLCFSDVKVIRLGQQHPRIFRDMRQEPVVLGHEVSMTIVGVGEALRDQYHPGDRYIIQADIWKDGVGYAYGYMIQGGLSEYGRIDQRVLNGDHGNYLIPVKPATGYAESALTEPWACVTAAYELTYRTGLKPGGTTWVVGGPDAGDRGYTIGAGFDAAAHPARLLLTAVPPAFEAWLRRRAAEMGIGVQSSIFNLQSSGDPAATDIGLVDDILLLQPTAELIEAVSPHLADHGVCALIGNRSLAAKVNVDIGRVHYNRWVYVGGADPDIARAYAGVPVRASLKPGGRAWFVGAGGPMGRMHVQRAIQVSEGPAVIVCTDVSDLRLADLADSYRAEAEAKGIEFICLNPTKEAAYQAGMARFQPSPHSLGESWQLSNSYQLCAASQGCGFDDIIVLAPVASLIADSAQWLAPEGVMNVFAGVNRGTTAAIDLSDTYLRGTRIIGHSASSIEDLRFMLSQAETGTLSPNRSVAAIGSLEAVRDGLQALMDTTYPGKVVIYPHIKPMPLTALPDLKETLPTVYAKLRDGREWTNEAEAEFLRLMLK